MPSDSYERLGEASVGGVSRQVPVPQQALDRGLLTPGGEAYWGVRGADDAVVVSGLYDPLESDGFRFLTSSVLDDDRMLTVPDAVFDHWDDVAGGGTAVEGGDRLRFVTNDDMEDDDQLLVVPDVQAADLLGEEA